MIIDENQFSSSHNISNITTLKQTNKKEPLLNNRSKWLLLKASFYLSMGHQIGIFHHYSISFSSLMWYFLPFYALNLFHCMLANDGKIEYNKAIQIYTGSTFLQLMVFRPFLILYYHSPIFCCCIINVFSYNFMHSKM